MKTGQGKCPDPFSLLADDVHMTTLPFTADYLQELQTATDEIARAAGRLLQEKFAQPRQIQLKGARDLVTDADFAAQKLITDFLRARYPEHGFLTEEKDGDLPADGPVIWVIDPLDGTSNYSRQQPQYCVSIAAIAADQAPLCGAVYDPVRDELFSAARGQGCRLNGQPIHVYPLEETAAALVCFDWNRLPHKQAGILRLLEQLAPLVHSVRATGSAALALAWVAAGRLDGYFNFGLNAWDMAAGQLLIAEAGGVTSNLRGEPWRLMDGNCLAGGASVHALLRQIAL